MTSPRDWVLKTTPSMKPISRPGERLKTLIWDYGVCPNAVVSTESQGNGQVRESRSESEIFNPLTVSFFSQMQ